MLHGNALQNNVLQSDMFPGVKKIVQGGSGMRKIRKIGNKVIEKMKYGVQVLQDESGMSVIELLLILVVIIALVLIFKNQLIDLVNTIFSKITSESAGI